MGTYNENMDDPFGLSFNLLKLKYETYDKELSDLNKLNPNDKINVFINLETCLKYISMDTNLDAHLSYPNHDMNIVASIINLAGHYKRFFVDNGLETRVFLYMTDLDSVLGKFAQSKFNSEYRYHYIYKFNGNSRYVNLTDELKNVILPMVKTLCDFIPNVYFIQTKNIDSSFVPMVVNEEYPGYKNCIITGDIYDTQYYYIDNFIPYLYNRGFGLRSVSSCTLEGFLKYITKSSQIDYNELELFKNNPSFYSLLLSCIEDRTRSTDGVKSIGYKTLVKKIINGLNNSIITTTTSNIDILSGIFDDIQRDELLENYRQIDLQSSYKLLLKGEKKSITSQIVDRIDMNGFNELVSKSFTDSNKIIVEALF